MAKKPKKRNKRYNPNKRSKFKLVYMTDTEFQEANRLYHLQREAYLNEHGPEVLTAADDVPKEQFTDIQLFLSKGIQQ
ncbi:TPA: hypothetical protein OE718_003125 [Escherichia coli]|uniref:hypothetical protein n=1 Tax=Escherichia coli TaxID=562 RepID=UPI001DF9AC97|nr:hypothetical protein [Escherichia coli]EEK9724655.1 hypothetical protein [Salmonella enterica]EIZ9552699.1 hypothetical protein [Shigella flexneri]EFI3750800.1 hypothetical protein [Escherichia coli]EIC3923268.1 hypothetical protein [Salmonella enterica]MCT7382231.1 hypothetical protein [Escherichia coli]